MSGGDGVKVPLYNMEGQTIGQVELRDDIFGITPHVPVMHQALVRQLANARLGTHKTKTRGEVSGGGRKPWRQKGTGRARHGSIRAPQWRGGGTVFGPRPRSYRQKMPKKMRHLAYKSALSVKAKEGQIIVLDKLEMPEPKTKAMAALLDALAVDSSALILLPERNENVEKSARNLPGVKTLRAQYLNVRDLLGYDYLVMPLGALEVIESILG
ncbi:MAG TPA: 50S ribosomal protein L4 [Anaerolineae bacterium]|nr:50S ribosomal protein L4 [Anaerolineae bacterium]